MPVITEIIERPESSTAKKGKPTIITWGKWENEKGEISPVKMIRAHSINACVHEIIEFNKKRQFLKINLIGMSGSGKTTLSKVLAHQIHTMSDVPYEVRYFTKHDLANFKATITTLSKNPLILVFDDLSGFESEYGKKALERVKSEITEIRHINESENRNIILMLSFHAQKMLDKFLRISNFVFYVDCQLEEIGYLEDYLGKHNSQKIKRFQRLRAQAGMQHKFTYPLGKRDFFTYKEAEPFLPILYNNGLGTRDVVSCTLDWILNGKLCQTCNPSIESKETEINLEQFVKDINKKFNVGIVKRAIELKLLSQGVRAQPKKVQQCQMYIEQYLSRKEIVLDELADAVKLKPVKTRLYPDKQPEYLGAIQ